MMNAPPKKYNQHLSVHFEYTKNRYRNQELSLLSTIIKLLRIIIVTLVLAYKTQKRNICSFAISFTGIQHDSLSNMSGMEAALASGLLKVAGDKLVSLIKIEFASITGVKKDLSDLQDIHGEITSWLSLVHHISIETNPRFIWVIKLKDVAYDIDDLVHEVELEAEKHKLWSGSDKNAIVDSLCAKRKSLLFRRKMVRKIKDIKVGYAVIVAQRRDANTVLHNYIWINMFRVEARQLGSRLC